MTTRTPAGTQSSETDHPPAAVASTEFGCARRLGESFRPFPVAAALGLFAPLRSRPRDFDAFDRVLGFRLGMS
jgi:hypothetical protein